MVYGYLIVPREKNMKRGLLCPWSRLPKYVIPDLWVRGLDLRVGPTWSHNEHVLDFRWIFYLFPQTGPESYFTEIIWVFLIYMELDVTKSKKNQNFVASLGIVTPRWIFDIENH